QFGEKLLQIQPCIRYRAAGTAQVNARVCVRARQVKYERECINPRIRGAFSVVPFRGRSCVRGVGSGAGLLETAQIRAAARNPGAPLRLDGDLSRNTACLAATLARGGAKSSLETLARASFALAARLHSNCFRGRAIS